MGLCRALGQQGVDVEVVTTTAAGDVELEPGRRVYDGVSVCYVSRTYPKRFFAASGFEKEIHDAVQGADLLHVHGLWNLAVWAAVRAAKRTGTPYVVSPRGMLEPAAMRRQRWLKRVAFPMSERPLLAGAARLIATSDQEAKTFARLAVNSAVEMISNGVDAVEPDHAGGRALRQKFDIPLDAPTAFFLGRIHPIKRVDLLCEAFELVRCRVPSAHLLIAGPDESGLRQSFEARWPADTSHVHFIGEIDEPGKAALFSAGEISVTTSDSESFGMAMIEAMSAGVPAVVVDTCPWRELDGLGAGRCVPQTAADVANALSEILSDAERRGAMGRNAKKWAAEQFSWSTAASRTKLLYQQVVSASMREKTPQLTADVRK